VFLDGVSAGLEGLFTRRIDLALSASYSGGVSIVSPRGPQFNTYTGEAVIRYALTRNLAVYGQYLYYAYDFHGTPGLAPDIPSDLRRNGLRAGLMLRVPVVGR
jgi:hypothetical protein